MTYWELVRGAAERQPDRVVLGDDHGRELTAAVLRDAAEEVAAALPVQTGSTVAWQLPTCLEAAVLMVALARLDVVQVPLIPNLRDREVGGIVAQLPPALVITPKTWRGFAHADMARSTGSDVLSLDLDGPPGRELRLPRGDASTLPPPPRQDAHWVYFTSGTTAQPKGVRHTDSTLIASAAAMIGNAGFDEPHVYPIAWPLAHIGGVGMLTCALQGGLRLVLFDTWDPAVTPGRMAAHRPTVLGSAQPFFLAYLDAQRRHGSEPLFPELRLVTAGGAPTPPELVRELVEVFGVRAVVNAYGMTEFPVATASGPRDPEDRRLRSVGRPGPGVRVRVVDGELRFAGPQAMVGYVDPALDAAAFDEDGWIRSGDLGDVDADGYVYVTGRAKDVIIRNAENVSALEVEDVLLRHPDVLEVAVVGVPDPATGERVCAVVVPVAGTAPDVGTLAEHCRAHGLARYKCPERVELAVALERNAMGKLVKQTIRRQLLEG